MTKENSSLDCSDIIMHMSYGLGSVIVHVRDAHVHGDVESLRKARVLLDREIAILERYENRDDEGDEH